MLHQSTLMQLANKYFGDRISLCHKLIIERFMMFIDTKLNQGVKEQKSRLFQYYNDNQELPVNIFLGKSKSLPAIPYRSMPGLTVFLHRNLITLS